MENVLIGLLAMVIGLLLCFEGYAALRAVIAAWGGFTGFLLGAGVVAALTGEALLGSVLAWVIGLLVAVAFGLIAYLYYAVSVVVGMAAIGFSLGTTVMVALGVSWTWLVVLVGVAVGLMLAVIAIIGELPMLILSVLGAFAGASVTVAGVLLLTGVIVPADLVTAETTAELEIAWWWTVAYLVLAVGGLAFQLRTRAARQGTLRDSWERDATAPAS